MSGFKKALNVEDLRKIARRKLPAPLFNYIDGGADDESNVRGNTRAFGGADLTKPLQSHHKYRCLQAESVHS